MHDLDSLLTRDEQPRPGLVAAARRGDTWLITLIAVLNVLVITAALTGLAHQQPEPTPQPTPTTSQQET